MDTDQPMSESVAAREATLLRRFQGGETAAFDALCLRLEGPLLNYALRLAGNRAEAEEIVQEALLRLFQAARNGRLRGEGAGPRPYVFSIAHNLAMDFHRREKRERVRVERVVAVTNHRTEQALLKEQVERALDELPESHRAALLLREYGELRYSEIAETLGASLEQVKVWIYRGRRRLAELLDRDGQFIGARSEK